MTTILAQGGTAVSGHGVNSNGKGKIKEILQMSHFLLDITSDWLYRMMGKRIFYDEKGIPKILQNLLNAARGKMAISILLR